MNLKLLVFFLSLICFTAAYTQKKTELALAKYHGSVYLGEKIKEELPIVDLLLPTGDTISINKYRAIEYYDNSNAIVFSNGKYFRNVGYFWFLTFGSNAGGITNSEDDRASSHLGFHYGYRFSPRLSLSGGFAFEFNEASASGFLFDTQYVPLYVYGRYHFFVGRPHLFGFGRVGYGFVSDEQSMERNEEVGGGINTMYGLGIIFASRKKSKFVLSLGHYLQKASGQQSFLDPIGNEIRSSFDLTIQRLILTVGWEFN